MKTTRTTESRSSHFGRLADILADVRYGQQRLIEVNRRQPTWVRSGSK